MTSNPSERRKTRRPWRLVIDEERLQIGKIDLWEVLDHLLEVEPRDVTQISERSRPRPSAQGRCRPVEPRVKPLLVILGAPANRSLNIEFPDIPMTNCEMSSCSSITEDRTCWMRSSLALSRSQIRASTVVRVAQDIDGHRPLLAVAREAADPLVEPHRIPRHIDVNQRRTPLLQVDAFTAGLSRHQKADIAALKASAAGSRGRLTSRPPGASHPIQSVIAVDEADRAPAKSSLQGVDHQAWVALYSVNSRPALRQVLV